MVPVMSISAELRVPIGTSISQIIDLLKDDNDRVRLESVGVLSRLSEHGM
jgi:hypothetical protein